jgi:L1 cell adhesion molecule
MFMLSRGSNDNITAIIIGVTVCLVLFIGCAVFFIYQWQNKILNKENAVKMTRVLAGMDREDNEPLRPTNVKPNLAKLRIIKEAEMRQGGVMGYGAFGTVYKVNINLF